MKHIHIVNTNNFEPKHLFLFSDKLYSPCISAICLCFMYLLHKNQSTSIQIRGGLFCIILKTCLAVKDTNLDLVLLSTYHVKYTFIIDISQLWHFTTFANPRPSIFLSSVVFLYFREFSEIHLMNSRATKKFVAFASGGQHISVLVFL